MGILRHLRGLFSNLPSSRPDGTFAMTSDTKELYYYVGGSRQKAQKDPSATDYTIYVATPALGGLNRATQGATGLQLASGTATAGTSGTNLECTGAGFTTALVNKPIYNATDDTWAKITAVVDGDNLTLDSAIFVSGEDFEIGDAIDNIPEAWGVGDAGFKANIDLRVSPGTFSDDLTLIGKTAGDNKKLTIKGSTTGTTTIAGEVSSYQKLFLKNLTFTKRIFLYFGSDIDWTTCVTSGDDGSIITKSTSIANTFRSTSNVTFINDPGAYVSIGSTVNTGYTLYVASATLGGSDANNDGLKITQGSATSTSANKLVDSAASFNATDHLNMTVFNSDDETWAKVTAVDSPSQLSLSADIMTSGESYVIAAAKSTLQNVIDNVLPGTINCETTIKVSAEAHSTDVTIQGKAFSGTYTLGVEGCYSQEDAVTATSGTQGDANNHGTVSKTGAGWTTDQFLGMWVVFDGDTTTTALQGKTYLIQSNTATLIKIIGIFDAVPVNGDTFKVYSLSSTLSGKNTVKAGQLSVEWRNLSLTHQEQYITDGALATFRQCDMPGFRSASGSSAYAYNCHIHGQGWAHRNVWVNVASYADINRCFVYDDSGSSVLACVYVDGGSTFVNGDTTNIIDGKGTKPEAIRVEINSNAFFWKPGGETKLEIRNATTGLYVWKGSQASYTGVSYMTFSGCTTDRSADAASYGYYAD